MEEPMTLIEMLLQLGTAGLMGVLWVWERSHSRQRERELTESHQRLMHTSMEQDALRQLVDRNTTALVDFRQTQQNLNHILEGLRHELATH